jgi:phage repressor protein C with HTH and peptisase S24 domain
MLYLFNINAMIDVKRLRGKTGMTQVEFADKIGIKQSYLSEIETGRRGLSRDVISKIQEYFDEEFLSKFDTLKAHVEQKEAEEDIIYVQMLPISAAAGSLNDFAVSVRDSDCEKIISPIRGADLAITISGDSMEPEYHSGSQILIKRINERAFIDWGKVYVLDTCNGNVIKKIFPVKDDSDKLKCVSINPEYPPFEVSLEDIYGIYRVLMCMSVK